jgi:hypothetical protein
MDPYEDVSDIDDAVAERFKTAINYNLEFRTEMENDPDWNHYFRQLRKWEIKKERERYEEAVNKQQYICNL